MTNPVIESLLSHRSIRRFKSDTIEPEKLDLILNAGIRAATAGNLQPYSFIVVDDIEKKKELDIAWKGGNIRIVDVPLVIVGMVDLYRISKWFEINDTAPAAINRANNLFISFWDAIIALQNMVIAAESLGLGTCYVGRILSMDIRELFNTPEYVFPAGMVCIGYPDQNPSLRMRLPLEAVVHRNQYQIPTDEDIKRFFKERDNVWEGVSEKKKIKLKEQNIYGIAQALAIQKFSDEIVSERSRGILDNIRKAGFVL
ncbi:MAG: nitroreductase family protein [Calditrichaeota bacterium]|nr:nitroreductase family protein [Calditrichota bacterium]